MFKFMIFLNIEAILFLSINNELIFILSNFSFQPFNYFVYFLNINCCFFVLFYLIFKIFNIFSQIFTGTVIFLALFLKRFYFFLIVRFWLTKILSIFAKIVLKLLDGIVFNFRTILVRLFALTVIANLHKFFVFGLTSFVSSFWIHNYFV